MRVPDWLLPLVLRLPKPLRIRLLATRVRRPNAEELKWAKRRARKLGLL